MSHHHNHFIGTHPVSEICPNCGGTFTAVGMDRHREFCDKVPHPMVLATEWANMPKPKSAVKLAQQYGVSPCLAFRRHLAYGKELIGETLQETQQGKGQGLKAPQVPNSVHCQCGLVIPNTEQMCEYCKGNDTAGYAIVKSGHKAVMQGNLRHVVEWLDKQGARYKLGRVFSAKINEQEYIVRVM